MKKASKHCGRIDHKREARFRVVDEKTVQLLPPAMTLEESFASVKPKRRPLDFRKMRDAVVDRPSGKVARK